MNNETDQAPEATSASSNETRPSINALAAKTEAKDILDGLINDLNVLILVTISAVYYFDCFSLLYFLRFFGQNQATLAGVRVVLSTNVICLLAHVFHTLTKPDGREGWNHGGLLVDFVGEKPVSRTKLVFFDFLIFALQILYLALYYKTATVDPSTVTTASQAQDLDAEEAGISRAHPAAGGESPGAIEMQSLLPRTSAESTRPNAVSSDPAPAETMIALRKLDFKEIFINTARNTGTPEEATRLQTFLGRLEALRARRAAQLARQEQNTT